VPAQIKDKIFSNDGGISWCKRRYSDTEELHRPLRVKMYRKVKNNLYGIRMMVEHTKIF
jgi:hypothetical protein